MTEDDCAQRSIHCVIAKIYALETFTVCYWGNA